MRMNAIVKMKKLILTFAVLQFLVLATGVYFVLERLVDVDHWLQAGSKWARIRYFGTYRFGEQRRLRPACTYTQSRQSPRFSLTQIMGAENNSDQKLDP